MEHVIYNDTLIHLLFSVFQGGLRHAFTRIYAGVKLMLGKKTELV